MALARIIVIGMSDGVLGVMSRKSRSPGIQSKFPVMS